MPHVTGVLLTMINLSELNVFMVFDPAPGDASPGSRWGGGFLKAALAQSPVPQTVSQAQRFMRDDRPTDLVCRFLTQSLGLPARITESPVYLKR